MRKTEYNKVQILAQKMRCWYYKTSDWKQSLINLLGGPEKGRLSTDRY